MNGVHILELQEEGAREAAVHDLIPEVAGQGVLRGLCDSPNFFDHSHQLPSISRLGEDRVSQPGEGHNFYSIGKILRVFSKVLYILGHFDLQELQVPVTVLAHLIQLLHPMSHFDRIVQTFLVRIALNGGV